jgi:hypothetical protein
MEAGLNHGVSPEGRREGGGACPMTGMCPLSFQEKIETVETYRFRI